MAFSQAQVSDVRVTRDGVEFYISWTSAAPWGTPFQVYVDRRLAWSGLSRACYVPIPADASGRNVWVEVGTVGPGEATGDFSGDLAGPGGTGNRARLTWYGGTYLDPTGTDDLQGFRIYRSSTAGSAVDFTAAVGTVAAYPFGVITDGFGMGGFGLGGFGRSASFYEWHSGPLTSGAWTFAVVPYDRSGNAQGSPLTVSAAISTAPRPPAADANGVRLTDSYSGPISRLATLNWLASPQ